MRNLFAKMLLPVAIFMVFLAVGYVLISFTNEIEEKGLKAIVEDVWYGENE